MIEDLVFARKASQSGSGRAIREAANLSLWEVAREIGTDASTISLWERAKRSPRGESAKRWGALLKKLATL